MTDVPPPLPTGLPQMRAPLQVPQLQLPKRSRFLILSLLFTVAFLQDAVLFWLQVKITVSDTFLVSVSPDDAAYDMFMFGGMYWFMSAPLYSFLAMVLAIVGLVRSGSKCLGVVMVSVTVVLAVLVPYLVFVA